MPDDAPLSRTNAKPADGGMAALGELICSLNPYTDLPPDGTTGLETGGMEVVMLPNAPVPSGAAGGSQNVGTIAGVALEIEQNYDAAWTFKGQAQAVKTAVRIPYRFPVYKRTKLAYWRTEYLLIGFAGAEGGG